MSQDRFVKLAKEFEAKKNELEFLGEQLESVMKALGPDTYIGDVETGAIYKIFKPEGTFVHYRDIQFKRTALAGEKGGTVLSKKEAEEATAKGLVQW